MGGISTFLQQIKAAFEYQIAPFEGEQEIQFKSLFQCVC